MSSECELLSFAINAELNPSLKRNYIGGVDGDTMEFVFNHFTDLSAIVASFEISKGATLRLDTIMQQSDTTKNNFYELLQYQVVAENDSNTTDFWVKSTYPLVFNTLGYSKDSARVGGGDFSKTVLYEVNNIHNGSWKYSLEANGFKHASEVKVLKKILKDMVNNPLVVRESFFNKH